jgi:hypothetical protein
MRIRSFTAPAALVAGSLLLTACGGDSPLEGRTGPEVAELAADALEESGAVRVAGTMTTDGQEGEVDLQLQGDDAAGSISFDGMEIELISVGGDVYMQAAPEFWASFGMPEDVAAQLDGEWVAVPGDAAADFADFSLAGIADELRSPEGEIEEETSTEELDGEDVVVVSQDDGSELVVADDDPPYPLEMRGGEDAEGTLTFSNHGEEEDISAPEDALSLEDIVGS